MLFQNQVISLGVKVELWSDSKIWEEVLQMHVLICKRWGELVSHAGRKWYGRILDAGLFRRAIFSVVKLSHGTDRIFVRERDATMYVPAS